MKKLVASLALAIASYALAACGPGVFPNRQPWYQPYQQQLGIQRPGLGQGFGMAGPTGAVANSMGLGNGGVVTAAPSDSIYRNTLYDPATHPAIIAQNAPMYVVGGGGGGGIITVPNGQMNATPAATPELAASQRDMLNLRNGVRVLMQQQVHQAGRLDRLERQQ